MGSKIAIGIMGPGLGATKLDCDRAYRLGAEIARHGWVLISGGRNVGVMDAANRGAKSAGGLTVGILPTDDRWGVSEAVDIAIPTGMGSARNNINVLASDVTIACGMGPGTASEIALALKANKKVIILNDRPESQQFFQSLSPQRAIVVDSVEAAIAQVRAIVDRFE
ncbi:TIGR00725 family protein [Oxynema aestuarii]|jgi:uncharacterized protein (TIGR00725 family)|uniref:TIGR00725 family protein n=1 Tax=Oxynema aestuarii AP17 TaxID=2064643 RepID=A0A6H1TUG9_9CYAN|nr:TIGR00725 family protein [Oxynema aestuarii]QIZ70201.1 TIGR00725 family protein [Oxynema aestuarii AP17]